MTGQAEETNSNIYCLGRISGGIDLIGVKNRVGKLLSRKIRVWKALERERIW